VLFIGAVGAVVVGLSIDQKKAHARHQKRKERGAGIGSFFGSQPLSFIAGCVRF
jgi:hypothetical protein